MYSLIIGWFSGPFVKFLKAIPPKVWYAFLFVTTLAVFVTHEKRKSFKKGEQKTLDEVIPEIKKQDEKRAQEADEILEDKIEEIRNEPIRKPEPPNVVSTTDELPSSSELQSDDPKRYGKLFGDNSD